MSLSTHVLDTATGLPAAGIPVELFAATDFAAPDTPAWHRLGDAVTDEDGRARLTAAGSATRAGSYRLRFHLDRRPLPSATPDQPGPSHPQAPFYPWVDITVRTPTVAHLHVPLLLSPFGYTTYRGS